MDQVQPMIRIYQICFYACLAITVLGIASAVFLFFRFDIRTIFEIRTGRAAKRTIEKMARLNATTGRLKNGGTGYVSDGLSGPMTEGTSTTSPLARPVPAEGGSAAPPNVGNVDTMPLAPAGNGETVVLPAEPSVLPPRAVPPGFTFRVTQSVLLIHTDEQI
ncbi:MAG TPA: hypothetical protein H9915_04760 [Candidatus Gemmiger faecigallinarum]|nr:hypothetical protein [Candidatus Gemmiger faecigallinarum]